MHQSGGRIFWLQGEGKIPVSQILSVKAAAGGLHVKAGLLPGYKNYIVGKLNTNFPDNPARLSLPTIQGDRHLRHQMDRRSQSMLHGRHDQTDRSGLCGGGKISRA